MACCVLLGWPAVVASQVACIRVDPQPCPPLPVDHHRGGCPRCDAFGNNRHKKRHTAQHCVAPGHSLFRPYPSLLFHFLGKKASQGETGCDLHVYCGCDALTLLGTPEKLYGLPQVATPGRYSRFQPSRDFWLRKSVKASQGALSRPGNTL